MSDVVSFLFAWLPNPKNARPLEPDRSRPSAFRFRVPTRRGFVATGENCYAQFIDGKRPDSLLPLRHGVDLPLRRFAPGLVPRLSVAGFLNRTKTCHGLFVEFTSPTIAPIPTRSWSSTATLLIGLSLFFGLMVRVSAAFGIVAHDALLDRAHGLPVHRATPTSSSSTSTSSMPACWPT